MICGPPATPFPKGLEFSRMGKSFPEWFVISAHGESHFPNGLEFPRMAKVISRMVQSFRVWPQLFPEWFGVSAHDESHFPNGFGLSPYI